jgi:phage major head subunit gpT-like protein
MNRPAFTGKGLPDVIINAQTIEIAAKGFQTVYTDARMNAPSHAMKIAMTVPSTAKDETYGWLGMFPHLREWIGPRHVKGLKAHGFRIENRKFEATVEVPRDDLADDRARFPLGACSSRSLRKWGKCRPVIPMNWSSGC